MTRVISACPTIFRPDGELDLRGTQQVMERALAGGVDSLFIAGSTAEFPALSETETTSLFEAAISVAGADRVIAHVGGASAYQAVALCTRAADLGIRTVAAITPYYFPAGPEAIFDYFRAISAAAGHVPLYAYLFPDRTGIHLNIDDIVALVRDLGLRGVKMSGLDVGFVAELAARLGASVPVYSGADETLAVVAERGAAGVVSGVSSALPRPIAALATAIDVADPVLIAELDQVVQRIVPIVGFSILAIKETLRRSGVIDSSGCRMAVDPLSLEVSSAIDDILTGAPITRLEDRAPHPSRAAPRSPGPALH